MAKDKKGPLLSGLGLSLVLWMPIAVPAQNLPPQIIHYPDLVILNGKILTADDQFTIAEALAIRDGKFLAVGNNALIRQMVGPETQIIDVEGKTVIPGIINTHLHLADNAERPINWWKNDKELVEGLQQQIPSVPEGIWVVRWFNSVVSPYMQGKLSRALLDGIAPNNPLIVGAHTGGYYVLNSLAFQKLDIPTDLEGIAKDPQTGEPTGEVIDEAARAIGDEVAWLEPMEEKIQRLREAIDDLIPLGTTTIHTRINADGITALRELWVNQELKLRWRVALTGLRGGERLFKTIGNLTSIGNDMLRLTGVAAGATDSFIGSGGAWTFQRKMRLNPNNPNDRPYGPEVSWKRSAEILAAAVKFGWSVVGIHSDGDRGTAEALAAYEKARATRLVPSQDQIFRLDHLSIIRPDEIRKMKELGIVPSVAAWHTFVPIKNLEYMYGPDRVSRFSPGRSFYDAGIQPAAEISSACPFWSMQIKVTRKAEDQVWGPYEKVSREEALKQHTSYAATYFKEQGRLGTIEAGKLADLAIVDGDYMTIPEDQIETLAVSKTVLGGKVVFETENPSPCASERYRNIQEVTAF